MHRLKLQLGLLVLAAAVALPVQAAAESVVPPGNSAVNQYTETFPTSKGQQATKKRGVDRSPREALGTAKSERLQSQGPAGRELAEVVAATAPSASGAPGADQQEAAGGKVLRADVDDSSALTEVIRQAGGSSDSGDGMGVVLPLLLLAAAVGFGLYAWRRRRVAA